MNQDYKQFSLNMGVCEKLKSIFPWQPAEVTGVIPQGDMPGDQAQGFGDLGPKAETVFKELTGLLQETVTTNPYERAVVSVCGGSGTGKTGIASLLSYYLAQNGIGSYTLSGDNYPYRIPVYNDAERLMVFRRAALQGMVEAGEYTKDRFKQVQIWQEHDVDADTSYIERNPWFASYIEAGREALRHYLGTDREIAFDEVNSIIRAFKDGASAIWLKKMGRTSSECWYDQVNFSNINVLVIEWTHGNSDYLEGIDIPVFLNSTPEETLEHRRKRGRDSGVDSPFTTMVLDIEQKLLHSQAHKAKIILSKAGEILSYKEYMELMEKGQEGGIKNE